jgi:hypothetical protein
LLELCRGLTVSAGAALDVWDISAIVATATVSTKKLRRFIEKSS